MKVSSYSYVADLPKEPFVFVQKFFQAYNNIKIQGKIVIRNNEIEFWRESLENLSPHKKVTIARSASSGFGISIKGGKEHNRPIIISKCAPRNAELKVGDRIISCAGKSLLNSTHREAVEAIKVSLLPLIKRRDTQDQILFLFRCSEPKQTNTKYILQNSLSTVALFSQVSRMLVL